jgi:hypothetical protein
MSTIKVARIVYNILLNCSPIGASLCLLGGFLDVELNVDIFRLSVSEDLWKIAPATVGWLSSGRAKLKQTPLDIPRG